MRKRIGLLIGISGSLNWKYTNEFPKKLLKQVRKYNRNVQYGLRTSGASLTTSVKIF